MRAIEKFYTSKRECSVQEAVYLLMPELWLQKPFPGVIFLNGNMPEKRYGMVRDKKASDELPEGSTDIFQRKMLDCYLN